MIKNNLYQNDFSKIKISIISPQQILSFSNGEIISPETLNYNNLKPIKNGLFCEKIFGSSKINFCACGKLYGINNNFICKFCKTSPNSYKFRRYNFGHLNLNGFFLNTLFFKSFPYFLSLLLDLSLNKIENILYNNYYLVLFPYKSLKFKQLLSFNQYLYYLKKYNNSFFALTSFECINFYLNSIDLNNEIFILKEKLLKNKNYKSLEYKKIFKRYKIIKFLFENNIDSFKNIILTVLPVLPADLRPIIKLSDNKLVSSDLNELYRRVIIRNNRFKKLKSICNSILILNNEKRLIQNSIDELIYSNKKKNIFSDNNDKFYKSIISNLKGKFGLFRHNLLGKRVDFSARGVIVSGPELKINECSIPIVMALELFRPYIYSKLINFFNIKKIKYFVDSKNNLAIKVLNNILKNNYLLLNRAPTLHKLSMQSFKILLNNDNVIKINPLVCSAFNADFDGDQMAVHIPISLKSKNEFKNILLSSNNILLPSNGQVSILPTQDIILGIYYATNIILKLEKNIFFSNFYDIKSAFNHKIINLNTEIIYRLRDIYINNNFCCYKYNDYKTTYGRILIYNILPKGISFSLINKTLRKKDISDIINKIYYNFNSNLALEFCDKIMKLGFSFVTKSGISISMDDILLYKKEKLINKFKKNIIYYNIDYLNGNLSIINRKKKIIDLWSKIFDLVFNFTIEKFLNSNNNSLYFMIDSGARGSELQIKQLCCMRGFVSYKNQGILDVPVLNSLKDGLNTLEYFYFSHISRKTLADTALKTSVAGYLTRKLIEVVNNVIISDYDCKTLNGLYFKNLIYNGIIIESFYDRIYGRILAEDIYFNNFILYKKNTLINNQCIIDLKDKNINIIKIRSPVTCELLNGICIFCYGLDLSKNKLITTGVAVGVIAGQSIGEPGTQLTMRTFHTSGVIDKKILTSSLYSNVEGNVIFSDSLKYILNINKEKIVISNIGSIIIKNKLNQNLEKFNIPYSSKLFVENNSFINSSQIICEWDDKNKLTISDRNGYIKFENIFENLNYIKRYDNITNKFFYEVLQNINSNFIIKVCDNYNNCDSKNSFSSFILPPGGFFFYSDNDYINTGDIICKFPIPFIDSTNITGGLPKVIDLFEAREPKNSAVLSEIDGYFFYKLKKKNNYLFVKNDLENKIFKKNISWEKKILVSEGSWVSKGDKITEGDINPHDILRIYGKEGLVEYYLSEIKNIYYSQGVKINDKHIEVILKEMLNKSIIINQGDCNKVSIGDVLKTNKIININNKLLKKNLNLIKYNIFLSGITKTSLNSDSFLSSLTFQNTSTVLSNSAFFNKKNNLNFLKNNVILGKIVPIGTGYYHKIFKSKIKN